MNDLGRRYFVFSGTPAGKQRIARIVLVTALVLQLVGSMLEGRPDANRSLEHGIIGFSSGLLLVAVVMLFAARRAR